MGYGAEIGLPISPEQNGILKPLIDAGVHMCRRLREPLTFVNVYVNTMAQASQHPQSMSMEVALLLANLPAVYGYVYRYQRELGVRLFADQILPYLDIEPGYPPAPDLVEQVGRIFVEELTGTYRRIKHTRPKSALFRLLNERGLAARLILGREQLAIKNWQSDQELPITHRLGRHLLCPRLYEVKRHVFAEEYIDAPPIMQFRSDPQFVAFCCGSMLTALHQQGVIYDHHMLNELLVESVKPLKLRIVDLGHAHFGRDFETDWQYIHSELSRSYDDPVARNIALTELQRWATGVKLKHLGKRW